MRRGVTAKETKRGVWTRFEIPGDIDMLVLSLN